MLTPRSSDDGFVLFEVLVTALILSLAGTAILLIGQSILAAEDRQLDHASAALTVESLTTQIAFSGLDAAKSALPIEDAHMIYSLEIKGTVDDISGSDLVNARIITTPKGQRSDNPIAYDFLAQSQPKLSLN